jgi:hypothetical protein
LIASSPQQPEINKEGGRRPPGGDLFIGVIVMHTSQNKASQEDTAPTATTGRIFEAHFADGTVTRMSVYTSLTRLDLPRAIKLSRAAYESRTKQPAVAIVAGRFETDGEILRVYSVDELREATP